MAIARVSSFDFTTPESMRNALQIDYQVYNHTKF